MQRRADETISALLEAAARILERNGYEGLNTNAIAVTAGVSIGSLYQYFPNKDALLSALIDREIAPLLSVEQRLLNVTSFQVALDLYLCASVEHQLTRPRLAKMIDLAEDREAFRHQATTSRLQLQRSMTRVLRLPDAPPVASPELAGEEVLVIIRSLVDAAGQRADTDRESIMRRVKASIAGYLTA